MLGECLPLSFQRHPAMKTSLTWRRGVVCPARPKQGQEFLGRSNRWERALHSICITEDPRGDKLPFILETNQQIILTHSLLLQG